MNLLNKNFMTYKHIFEEYQSEFYRFMILEGNIRHKTSKDYISRLNFLSEYYKLDDTITLEYIKDILAEEDKKRMHRDVYRTKKAMGDFSAGLKKFLSFINSNYHKRLQDSIIKEISIIEKTQALKQTEKDSLILSRIGQGRFRNELIKNWGGCSVTGFSATWMLIASHIKPWRDSNNQERLDSFNGLLLLPNLDKLFDKGYISFRPNGKVIFSKLLGKEERHQLQLPNDMQLKHIDARHLSYLKYHNEYCLL